MWLVYGAWAWLVITTLVKWSNQGDVAAANHFIPGLVIALVIHGGVLLYLKNKRPEQQARSQTNGSSVDQSFDNSLYELVAEEIKNGQYREGLFTRALAESGGDKDRTQSLYIQYRVQSMRDEVKTTEATTASEQAKEKAKAFVEMTKQKQSEGGNFVAIAKIALGVFVLITVLVLFIESDTLNTQQTQIIQTELSRLAEIHPDFQDIANDPVFHEWVKNQPADVQRLYASTSADDNIVLLNLYKNARKKLK